MHRRIATAAFLAFLVSGAAQGADEDPKTACIYGLIEAEELVYEKIKAEALTEAEAEELTALLDDADAACMTGKFDDAQATLDNVAGMVSELTQ